MLTVLIRNPFEAAPLVALARRAANGLEADLHVLIATPQGPTELRTASEKDPAWIKDLQHENIAKIHHCGGDKRYHLIEAHLKESEPTLLIVGKHLSTRQETTDTKFSRKLFTHLPCQTLIVRLCEDKPEIESGPILVSCGEGSHTRRALRLAHALAGDDTVAFHLRANVDAVSAEYAHQVLTRIVKRAGLDPAKIALKTTLGTDIPSALREQIANGHEGQKFSMLLLGDSQARGLREKLFGTIPEKLIAHSDGLAIGVIRAQQPIGHRLRNGLARLIRVKIPQLAREERIALFDDIESKARWNFDFATLMTLAALVAGLGLLANSGAVVIGAMLIAPLMMPLIGSGLALAQGHWPLFKNSLSAVVRGFLAALLCGLALGFLARQFHLDLTDELRARGNPTLLDLGVAFASGIAASYCIARPKLGGALAGVAIAAALVPPIVTVGICITLGEMPIAKGAGLLFGTNVVAVILGAALNFFLSGIRGQGKAGDAAKRMLILLTLTCVGLAVPLTSVLLSKVQPIEHIDEAKTLLQKNLPAGATILHLHDIIKGNDHHYQLTIQHHQSLSKTEQTTLLSALKSLHPEPTASVSLSTKTELLIHATN